MNLDSEEHKTAKEKELENKAEQMAIFRNQNSLLENKEV